MDIKIFKNKIKIKNANLFDVKKCLECGQIFRYKIEANKFIVFETDKKIEISQCKNNITILTNYPERHLNYFDLVTDYDKINQRISKINPLIKQAVDFGRGIRIFKQDFLEMIISFVISANNNIPRIKKSLFMLCEKFGENKGDYFAFPTLQSLLTITEQNWQELKTGYRAKGLVKLCNQLKNVDFENLKCLTTQELRKQLIELAGVGPKVADCVLLFAFNKKDVFPTDTWIKKAYLENINGDKQDAKQISKELSKKFGNDSGIIQQYLFYYKREKGDL